MAIRVRPLSAKEKKYNRENGGQRFVVVGNQIVPKQHAKEAKDGKLAAVQKQFQFHSFKFGTLLSSYI